MRSRLQPAQGLDVPQRLRDSLAYLPQTVWAHSLQEPIEWGGRYWSFCTCGWIASFDRSIDAPARCEFEQHAMTYLTAMDRSTRLATKEFAELRRLLTRT